MSLRTQISDLASAVGTDYKQLRIWLFGAAGSLSSLTTTDKSSLVAAINEAAQTGGTGGGTTTVTKASIGLGSVENYSPSAMPISDAVQAELSQVENDLAGKAESAHTHSFTSLTGTASLDQVAPGAVFAVYWSTTLNSWAYNGTAITARPTTRGNVTMMSIGGSAQPAFALNQDFWLPEAAAV